MKSWKTSIAKTIAYYYAHDKNWWLLTDCRNAAHSEGEWVKPPPSTLSDDRLSHKQYSSPTVHVVPEATQHEAAAFYLRPSGPLVLNEATELQDHSVLKPEQRAAAPHLHPLHCIKTPPPTSPTTCTTTVPPVSLSSSTRHLLSWCCKWILLVARGEHKGRSLVFLRL